MFWLNWSEHLLLDDSKSVSVTRGGNDRKRRWKENLNKNMSSKAEEQHSDQQEWSVCACRARQKAGRLFICLFCVFLSWGPAVVVQQRGLQLSLQQMVKISSTWPALTAPGLLCYGDISGLSDNYLRWMFWCSSAHCSPAEPSDDQLVKPAACITLLTFTTWEGNRLQHQLFSF